MAETIAEMARRDREAAVKRLMEVWHIGREQAEHIVAVELGEFKGDVYTLDADGNELPHEWPPSDWPRQRDGQ